jgi:hypothetical protein
MRRIIFAGLTAVGLSVAATAGSSAAPVSGAVIDGLATTTSPVTTVQYYGYYGGHWRYGSHGGHWRYGSHGGHWRWGSYGGHWRYRSHGY